MTTERTCPHCGSAVAADLNLCPHCSRPLPVGAPAVPPPPVQVPSPAVPGQPPAVQQAAAPPPPSPGYYQPPYPPGYVQPPAPGPYGAPPPPPDDTLAIISLVLSGLGIICCTCLSILCPVGLILAIIAHSRNRSGLAVAAVVLGILGTLLFVAITGWGLYLNGHPELRQQMLQQMFQQMGIPVPPGLPMP